MGVLLHIHKIEGVGKVHFERTTSPIGFNPTDCLIDYAVTYASIVVTG